MGGSIDKVKPSSLLAEILGNQKKIDSTSGRSKAQAIVLCQDEWPDGTQEEMCSEHWPLQGSFDTSKLTFLCQRLEDRNPQQMDYWFVWDNWAFKQPGGYGDSAKTRQTLVQQMLADSSLNSTPALLHPVPVHATPQTLCSTHHFLLKITLLLCKLL